MFLAHKCKSNIDFKLWFSLHQLFSLSLTLSISSLVLDWPHTVHQVYQRPFFFWKPLLAAEGTAESSETKLNSKVTGHESKTMSWMTLKRYKCSKCAGPFALLLIYYILYVGVFWLYTHLFRKPFRQVSCRCPSMLWIANQLLPIHNEWVQVFFGQSAQLQLPTYLDFLALCLTSPDISYAWYLDTFVYTCMQNWTLVS